MLNAMNWLWSPRPMPVERTYLPRTAARIDQAAGDKDGKVSLDEIDRVLADPDRYVGSVLRAPNDPAGASLADVQFLRNSAAGHTPLHQLGLLLFGGSTYGASNLVRDPVSGRIVTVKPERR